MLAIVLDHKACTHAQFSNSAMAETADIADSTWLVQICVLFLLVTSCKCCEEINFSNTFSYFLD